MRREPLYKESDAKPRSFSCFGALLALALAIARVTLLNYVRYRLNVPLSMKPNHFSLVCFCLHEDHWLKLSFKYLVLNLTYQRELKVTVSV